MKKRKKIFVAILCLGLMLINYSSCYAKTGSAYTPYGNIGGHLVQGTLIISTYEFNARTGYANIVGQGKAYFSLSVVGDYVNNITGEIGYRNAAGSDETLGFSYIFWPPANCSFISGSSYHSAYKDGDSWSYSLYL